jgi:hypothetical protein
MPWTIVLGILRAETLQRELNPCENSGTYVIWTISTVPDSRVAAGIRVEKGVWNFGGIKKRYENLMPESSRHLFQPIWDSRTMKSRFLAASSVGWALLSAALPESVPLATVDLND